MLHKTLLLLTSLFAYPCSAMDDSAVQGLLAIDAKPIHTWLTTNPRNKDKELSKEAHDGLTSLIETCQKYNVDPHLLFDLPDKRNSNGIYSYRCPEGQELTVQYINPAGKKRTHTIKRNDSIEGLPTVVSIFSHENHPKTCPIKLHRDSWLYGKRYNLLRLLLDCDRAHEALAILNATKQNVGDNNVRLLRYPYLELVARYKSDPDWVEKHHVTLDGLKDKLNAYEIEWWQSLWWIDKKILTMASENPFYMPSPQPQ